MTVGDRKHWDAIYEEATEKDSTEFVRVPADMILVVGDELRTAPALPTGPRAILVGMAIGFVLTIVPVVMALVSFRGGK